MIRYLIDSNYWINASRCYPFDIFPSFWKKMEDLTKSGVVVIHQNVMEELDRKDDDLKSWLHSITGGKVMPLSENAFLKYLDICKWAEDETQGYEQSAIDTFEENSRADAWICAEASASDLVIVTDETFSHTPKDVKIPNVCNAFNIQCINNLDFMRKNGFRF